MNTQIEGLPVSGYRAQSPEAVETVNASKELEEHVLRLIDEIGDDAELAADKRWLAIGRTQIEQGFMAVNRAVFKPQRIEIADLDAPVELPEVHTGWVIQIYDRSGAEPLYFAPRAGKEAQWTTNDEDALTFAREADARAYVEHLMLLESRTVEIVEIAWSGV